MSVYTNITFMPVFSGILRHYFKLFISNLISQEEAASILKTAIGPIRMKIGRLKAAASRRSAASTPVTVPATPTSDNK